MNSRTKKHGLFLIILVIVVLPVLLAWKYYQHFLQTPIIKNNQSVHLFFSKGETSRDIAEELVKKANLTHPLLLIIYIKLSNSGKYLKAGEYQFYGPMTVAAIIQKIRDGDVVQHSVTFIDGKTFKEVVQKLANLKNITHQLPELSQKQLKNILDIKHQHIEGLFFPDTYHYIYGASDLQLLIRAHEKMLTVLKQQWLHRAKNLPYKNAYQALIVASLIEKESSNQQEQELIAGVILNRLKRHMYLQIDPTVIYGMGNQYHGKITLAGLRSSNAYNTYRHKGLPPSPICLPGKNAIYAALHPKKTDYLYFVAVGESKHAFSKTLKQHDANIRKYILNKPIN